MKIEYLFYGYCFWVLVFWIASFYAAVKRRNVKGNLLQVFFGGLFWFVAAIGAIDDSMEGDWKP